jgi:hypothetical protein
MPDVAQADRIVHNASAATNPLLVFMIDPFPVPTIQRFWLKAAVTAFQDLFLLHDTGQHFTRRVPRRRKGKTCSILCH